MSQHTKYLEKAALLYAATSPSVSAHFMLQSFRSQDTSSTKSDSLLLTHFCNCCGTAFVPGWTLRQSTHLKSHATKTKDVAGVYDRQLEVQEQCLVCYREFRNSTPKEKRRRHNTATQITNNTSNEALSKANDQGVNRAKVREKRRRITALLQKSKEAEDSRSRSELNFSFLDFGK